MRLRWPNVEKALIVYLKTIAPVYTKTLGSMPDRYITLTKTGGTHLWIDKEADVEISVNSRVSRGDMWDLAGDVESAMMALAASAAGGAYIDNVACPFDFAYDPPLSQDVDRATATFTLTVRPI